MAYTDEFVAHAMNAYVDGSTMEEVADAFGISTQSVTNWKRACGLVGYRTHGESKLGRKHRSYDFTDGVRGGRGPDARIASPGIARYYR